MGKSHTKGRNYEQDVGKFLKKYDEPCPIYSKIATSTYRTGQQTNLQFDVVSKRYIGECKNRKSAPKWLMNAWQQTVDKAEEHGKHAMLALKRDLRRWDEIHMIKPCRHGDLIEKEKMIEELKDVDKELYNKIKDKIKGDDNNEN